MADTVDEDRDHLHSMGYAQELHRGMSTFSNFAISFSIISILAGGMTSFWLGLATGGPRVITLGWIIVGFFALLVGMAMGEICSAYPTAGGLYYWSAKLARKNQARWAWFTGYFNLLGQIGVIASVDYALAIFTGYFIRMFDDSFKLTAGNIFLIYLGILVIHGLLNTFSVNLVKILGDISVWWHVVGVVIIASVLFIAPTNTRGIGAAFDTAPPLSGWTGGMFITVYLFCIGLLLAQYTITGFDASAHVSEETVGARTEAPKAIVRSIYISAIAAFIMNLAMIAALPKKGATLPDGSDAYTAIVFGNSSDPFLVNAAPRLISGAVGSGAAKLLVFIALIGQFFCGLASVTANSRMIYAFSRDNALPLSRIWHKINPKTRTPTNSVWLGVGLSAVVGASSLYVKGSGAGRFSTAFFAMTGICVIGLYISYAIPIYLRLTNPDFQVGPWNLKGHHKLVGWTALAWIAFITVLFFSPIFYPFWPIWGDDNLIADDGAGNSFFKVNNFNFTGPLILLGALLIWGYWHFSGRKWFTGPKVQGTPEELRAIERELDAIEHGRAVD